MAETHVVGYTGGVTDGLYYGERFDRLENSCDKFTDWFHNTGNTKYQSFNSLASEERDGINLTRRGGISLVLRLTYRGGITEGHLKFCPFCGARVELKRTKSVELIRKMKEVIDGWTEKVRRQEPDQDTRVKEEFAKQPTSIKAELTQEGENRLDYSESPEEIARSKRILERLNRLSSKLAGPKPKKSKKRK